MEGDWWRGVREKRREKGMGEGRVLVSLRWVIYLGVESVPTARGNLTLRGGLYAVDGDLIL